MKTARAEALQAQAMQRIADRLDALEQKLATPQEPLGVAFDTAQLFAGIDIGAAVREAIAPVIAELREAIAALSTRGQGQPRR